jgi:serine protease Do
MDDNGEVNGHRPSRLLRRMSPGLGLAAGAGLGEVPDYAAPATAAVTGLRAEIPPTARTARMLGTEREGNAVIIDGDGLALTIGYLVLECHSVELMDADGGWVDATYVGYDFETGFGLARAQAPLGLAPVELGDSSRIAADDAVVIAGQGGPDQAMLAKVVARREFAGYWEYLLDQALFTAPAYPNWSGAALIGNDGRLAAIGSLLVEDAGPEGRQMQGNMFVPIDLLKPILGEMVANGRVARRTRPWLGMFTAEMEGMLVIAQTAPGGPAERAGLKPGDVVVRVDKSPVADLAGFYRAVWGMGPAGTEVPLTVVRDGSGFEITLRSVDRYDFYQGPRA